MKGLFIFTDNTDDIPSRDVIRKSSRDVIRKSSRDVIRKSSRDVIRIIAPKS